MVDDISHEGLRALLREEGVTFQAVKTWKESNDPDFEAKKNRILELYAIADRTWPAGPDDPTVVFCMDEFGPLNLQPHPGHQWAAVSGEHKDPDRPPRRPGGQPTSGPTAFVTSWPATTSAGTGFTAT